MPVYEIRIYLTKSLQNEINCAYRCGLHRVILIEFWIEIGKTQLDGKIEISKPMMVNRKRIWVQLLITLRGTEAGTHKNS